LASHSSIFARLEKATLSTQARPHNNATTEFFFGCLEKSADKKFCTRGLAADLDKEILYESRQDTADMQYSIDFLSFINTSYPPTHPDTAPNLGCNSGG